MTAQTSSKSSASHGSLKSYSIGFALSILLTILPIAAVVSDWFGRAATITIILIAAVLQFIVQLLFFMHLREGEDSKWNVMALLCGTIILVLVVGGSIWIMTFNQVAH